MTTPTPAQQLEEVRQARDLAMHYAAAAPVPLCGDFARIAQSLDAAMPMMERALAALEAVEHLAANAYDHHTPHMICIPVDEWKAAMKRLPADAVEVSRG